MADAIATMKTRPRSVSPFFIANMLPDTASGQIAIELGAKGPGDMGKVMGAVKTRLAGKADMGQVSAAVKAALAG